MPKRSRRQPARSSNPRRAIYFQDPEIANSYAEAIQAGVIQARNFSDGMERLALANLKTKRGACERKGIRLPAGVYEN